MILGVKKWVKKAKKCEKKGEKSGKICFINNFFSLIYRHIVKKVKKNLWYWLRVYENRLFLRSRLTGTETVKRIEKSDAVLWQNGMM